MPESNQMFRKLSGDTPDFLSMDSKNNKISLVVFHAFINDVVEW